MPLYRKILSRAFFASWQNKYLWFFGLFAAIVGSGGYEIIGQSLSSSSVSVEVINNLMSAGAFDPNFFHNLTKIAMEQPLSLLAIFAVFSIIITASIFILWLATVSQVAIVNNYTLITAGKSNSFQLGFSAGIKNFWSVFILNLVEKIVVLLVLLVVNLPLIFGLFFSRNIFTSVTYVALFVVLVPTLLVFSLLIKYAIAYVVIKNDTIFMSLRRAYQLFKDNWIVSFEMACLMFIVSFAFAFLIIILVSVYVLPFSFIVGLSGLSVGPLVSMLIIFVLAFVGLLFLATAGSFMSVLQISAWTDLFIEITGRGGESKIVRLFSKVLAK